MPSDIHAAIAAVMADVGHVPKSQETTSGPRFRYVGEADLLAALQPAMARHGLTIWPADVEIISETDAGQTRSGAPQVRTMILVHYHLGCATDDRTITITAPGCGIDSGDKGPYKAMTGAYKYALRQTFAIPTGDEPEATNAEMGRPQRPSRAPQRRQEPAQRPTQAQAPPPVERTPLGGFLDALEALGLDGAEIDAICEQAGDRWGAALEDLTHQQLADVYREIKASTETTTDAAK